MYREYGLSMFISKYSLKFVNETVLKYWLRIYFQRGFNSTLKVNCLPHSWLTISMIVAQNC